MIRAISVVGVQGKMFVPHLMKEAKEVPAMGVLGESGFWETRSKVEYVVPAPKVISMTKAQNEFVLKGMWGVVNNGGTARSLKISDWEMAGKTGTAQNSAIGSGGAKDHSWFMSFAPAYKPEIAVIGLIENSGFGGRNAAPAARGVYEAYVEKHHSELLSSGEKAELHGEHPQN
jgi:cell division protein FtsI/penicillin-binding protein 2